MKYCRFLMIVPLLLVAASCTRDPKAQAQRYLENGNKFFAREKFKEASLMYRRALQKDLKFGEAYYRLALTDLKLNAYSDAVRMLRRAVELQPENSDAVTKLADLYLLASTQDQQHAKELRSEVMDLAQKLIKANPDSFDGHRLMGQLALINRDTKGAIAEFSKANQVKPYQSDVTIAYFEALVIDGQPDEAEKLAKELIAREKSFAPIYDLLYLKRAREKNIAGAEEVFKLKTANNPKNSQFLLQLATHYWLQKNKTEMENVIQKVTGNEKDFPNGHMLAGDFFFFRAHEFERARTEYEAGIKANPKEKSSYQKRIVELLANSGKNQEANDTLATLLKENPKDADAIAMRAALLLTTGNIDQINIAASDLQSLVAKAPQNHLLRFNYARALLAKKDLEQARIQLEEAVKLRPDFMAARELLGRVYLTKGDAAKSLKAAEEILSIDRNNGQAHLLRSGSLLALGDRDKARDELDFILKSNPQDPQARYQVGYLAWQEKDYKKAEQIFTELHRADPKDLRGIAGISEVLAAQGKMPEAIKEAQRTLELDPQRKDFKLVLANLYVRSQKYDEAIALLQSLTTAEPRSADLRIKLAECYRLKGDLNHSMDEYRTASQLSPSDPTPLMQLSLLLEGTGKREQARPIYEQILRIQPDHFIALNNLAYMKAEDGVDLDQALSMAQRARQKAPAFNEIADTLGWIYIKKSLAEDAVRVFSELTKKEPGNPKFHLHYAMALAQKGDKRGARAELETALKNKPSTEDEGKIRQLLQTN